ncbi:MAG: prepilin-type N-terminal cleavage/methylation domain-containing protein [Phycisphaeraceae bacterium]|nr:prepilin-type N-terminal cleavage/methylation domain-containing protein [Phycisphaeraceae bacterium]
MHARKLVRKGFTLVEILIVVVILGILAAIVIPQFTNASDAAKASSAVSQLQTLRSQVELYKNQHNNKYPTGTNGLLTEGWDWTKLTSRTNIDGEVGTSTDHRFGPYMQQVPKNPFVTTTGDAHITMGTAVDGSVGWVLNTTTGLIRVSVPDETADTSGLDKTNDVAAY